MMSLRRRTWSVPACNHRGIDYYAIRQSCSLDLSRTESPQIGAVESDASTGHVAFRHSRFRFARISPDDWTPPAFGWLSDGTFFGRSPAGDPRRGNGCSQLTRWHGTLGASTPCTCRRGSHHWGMGTASSRVAPESRRNLGPRIEIRGCVLSRPQLVLIDLPSTGGRRNARHNSPLSRNPWWGR
jgi:hypothetical protein